LCEVPFPRSAFAKIVIAVTLTVGTSATTARAEGSGPGPSPVAAELTRQGRDHATRGDDALAVRRFDEAVRLDPSYGPAYLELAAARERAGDFTEAERTYDVAIEHVPNFIAAFRARAALLHRIGETARELADLEHLAQIAEGSDSLRALGNGYAEHKAWPAALAVFRRLRAFADEQGDDALGREASMQVRALMLLSAELDPVVAGRSHHDWVRRALASAARRRPM
jgi:tetratricopeptide (TPR) repeat protein